MQRATTSLLTLMFVVTTGAAGAVLHLCGMEGLVLRTCCCHEADEGPPVQLQRIDECCGAPTANGAHPPFARGSDKSGVDAPILMMFAVVADAFCGRRAGGAERLAVARGSPGAHGPPLFVWNCSYLI